MKNLLKLVAFLCMACAASASPITLGPCPDFRGLQYLYPAGPDAGYSLRRIQGAVFLLSWDTSKLGPLPEASAVATAAQHMADVDSMRADLRAAFAALPAGVQVFYKATFVEAQIHFQAGNVAAGREVIATTPVSAELAPSRDALLAIIDGAFP